MLTILIWLRDWLLSWCFRTAIVRKIGSGLRPNWRANVAALGEVNDFNAEALALILSFFEPEELERVCAERIEEDSDSDEDIDEDDNIMITFVH
jgi:hypothetical protein